MKTAKQLCEAKKTIVEDERKRKVDETVRSIIGLLEDSLKYGGDLKVTIRDILNRGIWTGGINPSDPFEYAYSSDPCLPRTLGKNHIIDVIEKFPETVSVLEELGYKVTSKTDSVESHKNKFNIYGKTEERKTWYGKTVKPQDVIVGSELVPVFCDIRSVTIEACCGEE